MMIAPTKNPPGKHAPWTGDGSNPGGDESKAMKGWGEGRDKHIGQAEGPAVTSLILIAHVNRIVHDQIAGYGFATMGEGGPP